MIWLIDHFDSFVETLARYIREAGEETRVIRVDHLDLDEVARATPRALVLSPGPGRPGDSPHILELFKKFPALPILGVCLGHQALCEAYGGKTIRAPEPMHGRASLIHHKGDPLFHGVSSPFLAGRYHSLLGEISQNGPLDPIAWGEDGTLMAARHKVCPHYGVQFHPESLLTPDGRRIIKTFLNRAESEGR